MPNLKNISSNALPLTPVSQGGPGGTIAPGATMNLTVLAYERQWISEGKLQGDPTQVSQTTLPSGDILFTKTITGTSNAAASPDPVSSAGIGELVVPVTAGMATVGFRKVTGSMTLIFECSLDHGGHWDPLVCGRVDATGAQGTSGSATTTYDYWEAAIPPGVTHVRARCTTFASSGDIRVGLSKAAYEPAPVVSVSGSVVIGAGGSKIGFIQGAGLASDDTSTVLAAGGTYTGTGKDAFSVASGTAWNSANTYGAEFRVESVADQPGTLYLEVSRDNATWQRVKAVPATQADGTSRYYAEINHKPKTRYCRAVYVNGATLQGLFNVQTAMVGGT